MKETHLFDPVYERQPCQRVDLLLSLQPCWTPKLKVPWMSINRKWLRKLAHDGVTVLEDFGSPVSFVDA